MTKKKKDGSSKKSNNAASLGSITGQNSSDKNSKKIFKDSKTQRYEDKETESRRMD